MTTKEEYAVLNQSLQTLRFLNIWPKLGPKTSNSDITHYRLKCFLNVILLAPAILGIMLHVCVVLKNNLDVDLSEDFSFISSVIGLHLIMLAFVWNQKKLAQLYQQLSDFEKFGKPNNFNERNRQLNLISKLYVLYCTLGIIWYALDGLLEESKCRKRNEQKNLNEICGMFVPLWTPFNIDYFPIKQLFFLLQLLPLSIFFVGSATISLSTYEVGQHIVLRIQHLNSLLREVFDNPDHRIQRRKLINCVKYHSYIINIFELFDSCYKHCNGCFVIMTGTIIACIAKQFVHEIQIGPLVHLGGWLLSLFACCHAGQSVLSESETIATAAYESKWYQAPTNLKKDLLLLMLRSQKPFYHHAIPIGTMTFSLFINIVKTSYSYFALLNESM